MMYFTGACPLCGLDVIMDTNTDNQDIIKIRTKRRSTVLVHKECYQNQLNQRGAKSIEH
jgi:hypothetical protein